MNSLLDLNTELCTVKFVIFIAQRILAHDLQGPSELQCNESQYHGNLVHLIFEMKQVMNSASLGHPTGSSENVASFRGIGVWAPNVRKLHYYISKVEG